MVLLINVLYFFPMVFVILIFWNFQTRFALALLKELAGVDFPADRIYGLGSG